MMGSSVSKNVAPSLWGTDERLADQSALLVLIISSSVVQLLAH